MKSSRFNTWTFLICFLLSLILVIHLLSSFISPIILALVIVSVFRPINAYFLRLWPKRPRIAASLSTIIVFLGVMIPFAAFLVGLMQQGLALFQSTQEATSSTQVSGLIDSLKSHLKTLNSYLDDFGFTISAERIIKVLSNLLQATGQRIYESIGLIATNLLSFTINFLLTIALVYVFFVSGQTLKSFLMNLIPLPNDEQERLVKRFHELSSAIFVGNGLISILEGVLGALSFVVFSIPGAMIWGLVMVITSFLPLVGASIVVIPASVYLFLTNQTWQGIVFLIFNIAQLTVLETFVKTKLIGTKSQMHAVLVFMAILAGLSVYGALGLFYGPLLVTVFVTLAEIYKEHYRQQLMRNEN